MWQVYERNAYVPIAIFMVWWGFRTLRRKIVRAAETVWWTLRRRR